MPRQKRETKKEALKATRERLEQAGLPGADTPDQPQDPGQTEAPYLPGQAQVQPSAPAAVPLYGVKKERDIKQDDPQRQPE